MAVEEIQEAFQEGKTCRKGQNDMISLEDSQKRSSGGKVMALNILRIVNMLRAIR
jgi:hypothetical protein